MSLQHVLADVSARGKGEIAIVAVMLDLKEGDKIEIN
jgi:hypothetical protein